MRGTRSRNASDEGMSLVEVIVAASILFIIMTGVIGLVGRTTLMSVQARQMNNINNTVNSYVEWARGLPFDDVALAPSGSLDTTVIVTGDYSIQIVPTVQPNANHYLKNLWLGVTATRADGAMKVVNTMVIIHDRDQYMTDASQGPSTDPSIVFLGSCPPDGTPVWADATGSWWKDASGNRPLYLQVKVAATSGRTVEEVYLQGEQSYYLQRSGGFPALWTNPTWSDSPVFLWDLNQKNIADEKQVQEGIRSVYAYVKDSAGVIRYDMRQFVVDNKPPEAIPAPLTHDNTGTMGGILSWPAVMDGTSPAYGYAIDVRKQPSTPAVAYSSWAWTPGYSGPETSAMLGATPMSRYAIRVRSYSPRGLTTYWSSWLHVVTRPKVTGTYSVIKSNSTPKGWKVTAKLTATAPSFESTSTTYSWYEGTTLLGTTTTNTFTAPAVSYSGDPTNLNFPARTYSVIVRTQPLGLPSGTSNAIVEKRSNELATVVQIASGTYTFTEGVW